MKQTINLTGQRFGRLTVLDSHETRRGSGGQTYVVWKCMCDCGQVKTIQARHLMRGSTQSCGCYQRDQTSQANTVHGKVTTPEYRSWAGIKTRCLNKNAKAFLDYGGRGIEICDRWRYSFDNFLEDMGSKPSDHHSIERIDNDGPYSPENCRWATKLEQSNNRRNVMVVDFQGVNKTISEWSELVGLDRETIYQRLRRGWSVEDSLTVPWHHLRSTEQRLERLVDQVKP